MCNPILERLDKEDNLLSIAGLKNAGQKYAANLDLKDFRCKPCLWRLNRYVQDITFHRYKRHIKCRCLQKFKQLMKEHNIYFNYFEYPDMFHDWVIITSLKESLDVINKVDKLLKAL